MKVIITFLLCCLLPLNCPAPFMLQDIRQYPGCAWAVNADEVMCHPGIGNGTKITNMIDLGPLGTNNWKMTTDSKRPTLATSTLFGHDTIRFNGSTACMYVTNFQCSTFITIFAVISNGVAGDMIMEQSANANSNPGFYWRLLNNSVWLFNRAGNVHNGVGINDWEGRNWRICMLYYDGATAYTTNGVAISNGSITGGAITNISTNAVLHIASRNDSSLFGTWDVQQMYFFTNNLSTNDQLSILYNLARTTKAWIP